MHQSAPRVPSMCLLPSSGLSRVSPVANHPSPLPRLPPKAALTNCKGPTAHFIHPGHVKSGKGVVCFLFCPFLLYGGGGLSAIIYLDFSQSNCFPAQNVIYVLTYIYNISYNICISIYTVYMYTYLDIVYVIYIFSIHYDK